MDGEIPIAPGGVLSLNRAVRSPALVHNGTKRASHIPAIILEKHVLAEFSCTACCKGPTKRLATHQGAEVPPGLVPTATI